ncbi:DUF397 domain-containing protein [Streptomyces sp. Je 1-4 4N24_ara]
MRDTKDHGRGPVLAVSPAEWSAFTGLLIVSECDA